MARPTDSRFVRLYRRLTALYPAAFRQEYEAELIETVRNRESENRGLRDTVLLSLEILADLFTTAPKEHWHILQQDLRHAVRMLRKTLSVTVTVLIVLAISIGATTTVFSIVNAVLLRPLPFANPDRLVFVEESSSAQGVERMGPSYPNLLDYKQAHQFESIGAYVTGGFSLTGQGEAERVDGAWVSSNLFPTLGVTPIIGRQFTPQEDQPNVETAVMLSYSLWQNRFGRDRAIIGRSVEVNGRARTVVGIMPPGFGFPETAAIWGPLSLDPKENTRTDHYLTAVGRLRSGVTVAQGQAELESILARIRAKYPETGDLRLRALPLRQGITGEYRPALLRLLGAVGFVLAIACTNIMNLLLARGSARTREIAIRTALGAGRRRLVRQLLTESIVLGALGGVLGLLVGIGAMRLLIHAAPIEIPFWVQLDVDWRVLTFVAGVTVISVLLFGIGPALTSSQIEPAGALDELRRGVTAGVKAGRVRQALAAAQVALSVVLLVSAGLMIRSFLKLQQFDLGFHLRDVLTFRIALPQTRYADASQREIFYSRMRERLAAIPGVRSLATATGLPMEGGWWRTVQRAGEAKSRPGDLPIAYHVMASPGYFGTMGIPLKGGRDFKASDLRSVPIVIVSEKLAKQEWPGRDPIGQRLRIDPFLPGEPWRAVVGVVGDVRVEGPRKAPPSAIYVPEAYDARPNVAVLLRSDLPATRLVADARRIIRSLDPELPLYQVRPVAQILSEATWQFRFYTALFSAFAAIAVFLAAVGLGGVMAHAVTERTHEIGVRMALGATSQHVLRMVLLRAFAISAVGAIAGIAGAVMTTRFLASLLFEVNPSDAATVASVLAVLMLTALVASWLPARRAACIDPADALRWE